MNERTFEDAFNLLCGDKIGSVIHREVFRCKLRPDLVVKVEIDEAYRSFANVREQKFWDDWCFVEKVTRWLAPCEYLSPDGRILLQRRTSPVPDDYALPDKVPGFLTDLKRENFGILDGKLVCVDYAAVVVDASARLKRAVW